MLYAWGFEKIGIVASDLFFVDPDQKPGEEGAEHGVRLEVRFLDKPPVTGSVYSAQPIHVGKPVWRADLLETITGSPGSQDRHHHHPGFRDWEPSPRSYDQAIKDDTLGWLTDRLRDLSGLLAGAGLDASLAGRSDAAQLAAIAPDIAATVGTLLDLVRRGLLGQAPAGFDTARSALVGVRSGWL
jgi:hypothetical protein